MIELVIKPYCHNCHKFDIVSHKYWNGIRITCTNIDHCENIEKSIKTVSFPKWISIEERLPTSTDANGDGAVLANHKTSKKMYFHWSTIADNAFDFTSWMSIPETSKEGEVL